MHSMANVDTAPLPEAATAKALMILADGGRAVSEVLQSIVGHDALVGNSAVMVAALLWLRGPMRPGEIAKALSITTGGSTKIVARLEKAGIVRKRPQGSDGRSVIVTFTEEGESTIASVLSAVAPAIRDLLVKLDDLEVTT